MTSTVPAPVTRTAEGSALQAVLLDMDGTLVDTEGFWWDVEVEIFAELGHTLDDSWRHVVVGGPMTRSAGLPHRGHRRRHHPRRAHRAAQRAASRTASADARAPDARRRPAARRAGRARGPHRPGLRLAPPHHRPGPASLGPQHFALTVAGDEVARTKPHPDPYLLAAARPRRATRRGARSSRTPRPASPPPRPPAAGSWPCPPWRPSRPPPGRTVVPSLEEVDLPFLRGLIAAELITRNRTIAHCAYRDLRTKSRETEFRSAPEAEFLSAGGTGIPGVTCSPQPRTCASDTRTRVCPLITLLLSGASRAHPCVPIR